MVKIKTTSEKMWDTLKSKDSSKKVKCMVWWELKYRLLVVSVVDMVNLEKSREKKREAKAPYLHDVLTESGGDYNIDDSYILSVDLLYEDTLKRQNCAPKAYGRKLSPSCPCFTCGIHRNTEFEGNRYSECGVKNLVMVLVITDFSVGTPHPRRIFYPTKSWRSRICAVSHFSSLFQRTTHWQWRAKNCSDIVSDLRFRV